MAIKSNCSFKPLSIFRNHYGMNEFLMYSGRYSFYQVLKILELKKDNAVLLPSYHCFSMIEPVVQYGCEFHFYKINKNLETIVSDIATEIMPETKVVVITHYFGHYQKHIREIKEYLAKQNIILIEDCAHALPVGNPAIGAIGDFSIFTPRKFLPVIDGAILRVNSESKKPMLEKLNLFREIKAVKNSLEAQMLGQKSLAANLYFSFDKLINDIRNRNLRKNGEIELNSGSEEEHFRNETIFDAYYSNKFCSHFSSFYLKSSNFMKIYQTRKHLSKKLNQIFYESGVLNPPFFFDNSQDYLLGFPLLSMNRKKTVRELKNRNIQTFTFGDPVYRGISKHLPQPPDEYVKNLFFLPLNQSIANCDIEKLQKEIISIMDITGAH